MTWVGNLTKKTLTIACKQNENEDASGGEGSSGSMRWPAFRSCKARGQGDQSLAKVSSDHPNSLSLDTYGGLSRWSYGGSSQS